MERQTLSPKDRIIFPLDVSSSASALRLVDALMGHVGRFKLGFELHHAMTAEIVTEDDDDKLTVNAFRQRSLYRLIRSGGFWDGKFKDIPNTVGGASAIVGQRLKMKLFNVHASASIDAMKAAAKHKGDALLLAVTVLTSMSDSTCFQVYGALAEKKVLQFAHEAKLAGADGIVCSPQELVVIRSQPELAGLITVVPGIQADWTQANDQRRVTTPAEAIRAGADYLVIGRSISKYPEKFSGPADAADAIAEQIAEALGHS